MKKDNDCKIVVSKRAGGTPAPLLAIAALLAMLLLTSCSTPTRASDSESSPEYNGPDKTHVTVLTERDGDCTHFTVENDELSEVTMTFDFATKNMKSSVKLPYTATFKPGKTEAFTLTAADPNHPWEYSYTNYFKMGSSVAAPDDYVYSLPYLPGHAYPISQGYDGKFSHFGPNEYAIDWALPLGTPVCAARAGLVVKVKDDSNKGGGSMAYDKFNNYILIRHSDGTLGHYCHLKKGGVRVKPGDRVVAGEVIALSGDTGFSTGPHLHFSVFKTKDGEHRLSIPVKFRIADGEAITLAEGNAYQAPAVQTAKANTATPNLSMR